MCMHVHVWPRAAMALSEATPTESHVHGSFSLAPQPQSAGSSKPSRQRHLGMRHSPVVGSPRGGPGGRRAVTYLSYSSGVRGPFLRRITMCVCGLPRFWNSIT